MSPASSPSITMDAMKPAIARFAPRLPAATGMIGMIAPSPTENSRVGRKAARATERKLNGRSSEVMSLTPYNFPLGVLS